MNFYISDSHTASNTGDFWDWHRVTDYLPKLRAITFENALPFFDLADMPDTLQDITIKCCRILERNAPDRIEDMVYRWSRDAWYEDEDKDKDISPRRVMLWHCDRVDAMFIQRLRRIGSGYVKIEWK